MDKNDKINQIITHLASAATAAADGMTDVVQSAGKTMSTQYDKVKLNIEINRLHSEQNKIFSDIGRTMFLINSGAIDDKTEKEPAENDAVENSDTQENASENATKTNETSKPEEETPREEDPQEAITRLLILADQKQQEIDATTKNLSNLTGTIVCSECGNANEEKDAFCSSCGNKLS